MRIYFSTQIYMTTLRWHNPMVKNLFLFCAEDRMYPDWERNDQNVARPAEHVLGDAFHH